MPDSNTEMRRYSGRKALRLAAGAAAACLFAGAAALAAAVGLSKGYSAEALTTGSREAAERAVGLTPSDPEARYARAVALSFAGDGPGALREYERAAALRPRDYFLWLAVGSAREQAGNMEGALAAYREGVRLAPHYAQPRWLLGNALFRAGRREEGFAEMRRAARSDPQLLPAFADLAWTSTGGDPAGVEQIVRPEDGAAHLALARLLFRKGRAAEAAGHLRSAGEVADEDRRSLLRELLSSKRYREAYQVWLGGREAEGGGAGALFDGGFEGGVGLDEAGFGWRVAHDAPGLVASLDGAERREGARSLLLEWRGNADPSLQAVSQLVPVEPGGRYRLNFSARTADVVTGGPPVVVVGDAAGGGRLAESAPLGKGAGVWSDYSVEFATGAGVTAVVISLRRQSCSTGPCPMFGKVWLDAFGLRRL